VQWPIAQQQFPKKNMCPIIATNFNVETFFTNQIKKKISLKDTCTGTRSDHTRHHPNIFIKPPLPPCILPIHQAQAVFSPWFFHFPHI